MSSAEKSDGSRGLLAMMVRHPVAANLLMVFLILVGSILMLNTKREVFPSIELDRIGVYVSFPGASAQEIEESVILAVEQSVQSIRGVRRITSEARRDMAVITLELERGEDRFERMQEVQVAVNQIQNFPVDAERPIVRTERYEEAVLSALIYGERSQVELHRIAEEVRRGLLQQVAISRVEHAEERQREITIEVNPEELERYSLSYQEIAGRVSRQSLETLGGVVEGSDKESLVRYSRRLYTEREYEALPVLVGSGGEQIALSEIARVTDGFGDARSRSLYNGNPAVQLTVFREGQARPAEISEAFVGYFEKHPLPEGISYQIVENTSVDLSGRIGLMLSNAWMGILLVGVVLGLFLSRKVALWVMIGIPTCFIGAFIPIYAMGGTINMFSLSAFIISLGVVVDDAIIMGESIYKHRQLGVEGRAAAYRALRQYGGPVTFAVLTNIVAFLPMLFLPGFLGQILFHIPVVVVSVFLISLVESLLILPAHLATSDQKKNKVRANSPSAYLQRFAEGPFVRLISLALSYRYISLAALASGLMLLIGLLSGGVVKTALTPELEANSVVSLARLPAGVPFKEAERVEGVLLNSLDEVVESIGLTQEQVVGYWSLISDSDSSSGGRLSIRAKLFLDPEESRTIGAEDIAGAWADSVGSLPGTEFLSFSGSEDVGSEPMVIELKHQDLAIAQEAALEFEARVQRYGLLQSFDRGDGLEVPTYDLQLNERGRGLGISDEAFADSLRATLYGVEALRFQDELEEVKVMVRGPLGVVKNSRELEGLRLNISDRGIFVLGEVADVVESSAKEQVVRSSGSPTVVVTMELKPDADGDGFGSLLSEELLPELLSAYPGLDYEFAGEQREDAETLEALSLGLGLSFLGIYSLLAVSFNCYWKPLVVGLAVPFGIGGAILGHFVMSMPFSLVSFVGVLALSGIVVNDALVLVHSTNEYKRSGKELFESALLGAKARFRPILLTSLTTFFGLLPMLLETSMQALFLVPMAVSVGFGVLFTTFTTLMMVPALLLVGDDIRRFARERLSLDQKGLPAEA